MRVTVLVPQMLRSTANGAARVEVDVPGQADLGGALDALAQRHPALERRLRDESRTLRRYVNFYVDGEECRNVRGVRTVLADGAEIQVIPSVAGG